MSPRLTAQTQLVLEVFLSSSDELYGLQIVDASGLQPGTIYPILQRLRAAGWLADRWEDAEYGENEGRPSRRYYWLTAEGRTRAYNARISESKQRSAVAQFLRPDRGIGAHVVENFDG